jgi:hypothetical protein
VEEANAVLEGLGSSGEVDRATLAADRAEAAAELAAARRSLGLPELPPRAVPAPTPEPEPVPEPPPPPPLPPFDPGPLREAAQALKRTEHELHRAQAALAALPSPAPPNQAALAVAEAEAAREQLVPARRRLAGALISGTGMAIVITALGWPAWWYLVPTVLIAIITADLRVAGAAAKEASAQAEHQLRVPARAQEMEAVTRRAQEARRRYAEAEARWADLAPGVDPADVESLAEREEAAVREASARAAPAAAEKEPDTDASETPETEPAEEPLDLIADLPDPGDDPVRALAVRLAEDAARTLAAIDRQLADLTRVEYARLSLEWHAANSEAG